MHVIRKGRYTNTNHFVKGDIPCKKRPSSHHIWKNGKWSYDDISEINDIKAQRQIAYDEEAHPLYVEWQFDQTPELEQAWKDKVQEIKERLPIP